MDYGYDAKGRLLNDALGRSTYKIVTTTHGTTDTRFLWQGYRLLQKQQEQQESGLCSTYVYDPNETWIPQAQGIIFMTKAAVTFTGSTPI